MNKKVMSLVAAASVAGLGLVNGGLSGSAQACPGNYHPDAQRNTTNYVAGDESGGVYDSGGTPGSSTSGYIGVAGSSPAGDGYVEANGNATAPQSGYIVASQKGGSGVEVSAGAPGPC